MCGTPGGRGRGGSGPLVAGDDAWKVRWALPPTPRVAPRGCRWALPAGAVCQPFTRSSEDRLLARPLPPSMSTCIHTCACNLTQGTGPSSRIATSAGLWGKPVQCWLPGAGSSPPPPLQPTLPLQSAPSAACAGRFCFKGRMEAQNAGPPTLQHCCPILPATVCSWPAISARWHMIPALVPLPPFPCCRP